VPVYYNDIDPISCAVTRELIQDGLLPKGYVDERPIQEVQADDLVGYTWASFFNGFGGWVHALELAGWPRDRQVWLASLPCQPWSCAGKGEGEADERHLWPVFRDLVAQCRPDFILGEQVPGAVGKGWLDGVRHDLENLNFAVGVVVLPACGQGEEEAILVLGEDGLREKSVLVGPPHIRQRLFWGAVRVADVQGSRWGMEFSKDERKTHREIDAPTDSGSGLSGGMADSESSGSGIQGEAKSGGNRTDYGVPGETGSGMRPNGMEHNQSDRLHERGAESGGRCAAGGCCDDLRIPNAENDHGRRGEYGEEAGAWQDGERRRGLTGCCVLDGRMENAQRSDDRAEGQCDEALLSDSARPTSGIGGSSCDGSGVVLTNGAGPHAGDGSTAPARLRGPTQSASIWSDYTIVTCRDRTKDGIPKARRIPRQIEPGILRCSADGIPYVVSSLGSPGNPEIQRCEEGREEGEVSTFPLSPKEAWQGSRVGLLKLAGNAINCKIAAEFVRGFMECINSDAQ